MGPFKKGAFRIAMARGHADRPDRDPQRRARWRPATRATINPGTVDVAVLPPISVRDWTLETLPERIAEVRQLYLDTLADWPVDDLPEVGLYAQEKGGGQSPDWR